MSQTLEAVALDRLLDPVSRTLTTEAAREIASLRADPDVEARIEELAERNTEGRLTPQERAEYEGYVRGLDLLGILQAKARARLARGSA